MAKVMADETGQKLASLAMELLGPFAPAPPGLALGEAQAAPSSTGTRRASATRSPAARPRSCAPPWPCEGLGLPREP